MPIKSAERLRGMGTCDQGPQVFETARQDNEGARLDKHVTNCGGLDQAGKDRQPKPVCEEPAQQRILAAAAAAAEVHPAHRAIQSVAACAVPNPSAECSSTQS